MLEVDRSIGVTVSAAQALLEREVKEHHDTLEATAAMLGGCFADALAILEQGVRRGGKLMLFGNGGSAANAQHIAAELIVRYRAERPAVAAIALTTDSSVLTACGNDMCFEA